MVILISLLISLIKFVILTEHLAQERPRIQDLLKKNFLDEGINDTGIFKDEKPLKERVNKISTDNITNNIVNNNVVQEIVEKKKPDLVTRNNDNEEFNKRKRQLINRLKYDPREVVAGCKEILRRGWHWYCRV